MINEHHIAKDWEKYEEFRVKKKVGLTTGFKEIDGKIWSLPGITTLVGDTKLGKSYFTMNIYLHLAKQGIPVILVDKEVGFVNVRSRLLCYLSKLTEMTITSGKFIKDEEARYNHAVDILHALPIYYFSDIKQEEIEPVICEAGKLHGRRVFVVIDSINRLIQNFTDRRSDVDTWGTLFNNLKLKYDNFVNFWIICEENKEEGIKESGTLKHLTELWLRMYKAQDKRDVILECRAQRFGPSGVVTTLTNRLPFCYEFETVEYLPE